MAPLLRIYHSDYLFLMVGFMNPIPSHAHHAFQFFLSHDSWKLEIDGAIIENSLIAINRNVEHRVISCPKQGVSILIDADSLLGDHLSSSLFMEAPVLTGSSLESFSPPAHSDPITLKQELLGWISRISPCQCSPQDSRIIQAKEIIDKRQDHKISLEELAGRVALSEGRLTHLFKEEVGIPLRKYLLWKRQMNALKIIVRGSSMTKAAYDSGFSDSAHLTRTFKNNFGLNLQKVFRNSQFIQFFDLNEV